MFKEWLQQKKSYSAKSSSDAQSRFNRVLVLTQEDKYTDGLLDKLEELDDFKKLSMTVKSQLRRSVKLYCEFLKDMDK